MIQPFMLKPPRVTSGYLGADVAVCRNTTSEICSFTIFCGFSKKLTCFVAQQYIAVDPQR